MHRFKAPAHTASVFTSTGEHRADAKGIISLAAHAPASDHEALRAAGCQLLASHAPATNAPPKFKRASKPAAKAKPAAPAAKPSTDPA